VIVRRDLRLLAGAVFLSAAADLLALVVLALHVHELTRSGLAVSGVFAAASVPIVALAPLAGLLADRLESVRVLVVASLAQAAVAIGLALADGSLAAILALTALLAAGNAVAQPAEFALAPAVAGAPPPVGQLAAAEPIGPVGGVDPRAPQSAPAAPIGATHVVGVLESARYAGFAAGPLLAAALAPFGARAALLVTAACLLGVALGAGAMRVRRRPPKSARGPEATACLRLLRGDPVLRPTLTAAVGALCFISAALTVEVFYLEDVVGAGDAAYALLVGSWMAGMVLGATALARRVPAERFAVAALVALAAQGAGMAVQTAWAVLPVAFAGYVLGGIAHGAKNTLLRALLLVRVPGPLHGRAFAAYNGARNAAELGALVAGGALVGVLGARPALLLAGLGPMLAAAAGLAVLPRPAGAPARDRIARPEGGAP
jgi:Na+/melibiose symporter-like transporter